MTHDILKDFIEFSSWNVKYNLLKSSINYTGTTKLIDFACGRGNDLNRWIQLHLQTVIGFDILKSQIDEAIKRYNMHKDKDKIKIIYKVQSISENMDIKYTSKLISCNFALNHFVNNIDIFLRNIYLSLEDGGIFIGTATDGDILNMYFNIFGSKIDNKLYKINKIDVSKYNFLLKSSFFKNNEEYKPITEQLLFKKYLIERAEKHNLYPYSTLNGIPPIINFANLPDNKYKNISELCLLYFMFSFKKVDIMPEPRCISVKNINEITSDIKQKYNYCIINPNDIKIPDEYYKKYPLNNTLLFKSNDNIDYFSSSLYTLNPANADVKIYNFENNNISYICKYF